MQKEPEDVQIPSQTKRGRKQAGDLLETPLVRDVVAAAAKLLLPPGRLLHLHLNGPDERYGAWIPVVANDGSIDWHERAFCRDYAGERCVSGMLFSRAQLVAYAQAQGAALPDDVTAAPDDDQNFEYWLSWETLAVLLGLGATA